MNVEYPYRFKRTSNRVKLDGFLTQLNIPKWKMKDYAGSRTDPEKIMEDIHNQVLDNIVKALKDVEPDVPDDVLRAFANMYMGYELVFDDDIKTLERRITCKPFWKDTSMIDFDSKEAKLLDDYVWSH